MEDEKTIKVFIMVKVDNYVSLKNGEMGEIPKWQLEGGSRKRAS
jgi:hypothetical protein